MQIKGILIDPHTNFCIEREVTYENTRIDNMYYKVDGKDLIPIAYLFPIERKQDVLDLLQALKDAKNAWEATQARIFYVEFPKLR